ncbi:MAG: hypothetical protein R3Y62_02925, partial [Eubacteriales bacterium]
MEETGRYHRAQAKLVGQPPQKSHGEEEGLELPAPYGKAEHPQGGQEAQAEHQVANPPNPRAKSPPSPQNIVPKRQSKPQSQGASTLGQVAKNWMFHQPK